MGNAHLEEPRGSLRRRAKRVARRQSTGNSATSSGSARARRGGGGLGALADAYLERLRARGFAAGSLKHYRNMLNDFRRVVGIEGVNDARGVLTRHVDAYGAELATRGLALSTRLQRLRLVRAFFADLVERGHLLVSPVRAVRTRSRTDQLPKGVPNEANVVQLLEAVKVETPHGVRDRAMLEVLYGSALRASELVGLNGDDIELTAKLVRVRLGKGARDRQVPLAPSACLWLRRYLAEVRREWLPRGSALFVTRAGRRVSTWTLRAMLERLSQRALCVSLLAHTYRHAAATHMVNAGADIRFVQELLGHASVTTTQIYTRVRPLDVKRTHATSHPREVAS